MKDILQDTNDVDSYAAMESSDFADAEEDMENLLQSFSAPFSKEELRSRLERSRQDYLSGRVYTTAEVLAMCRKQVDQMSIAV